MKKLIPLLLILAGLSFIFLTLDYSKVSLFKTAGDGYKYRLIRDENLGQNLINSEQLKQVDDILIKGKSGAVRLIKKSGKWLVFNSENVLADTDKLNNLFKKLASIKLDKIVTGSSLYYSAFGVSEKEKDNTVELRLKKGKNTIFNLLIGNKKIESDGVFAGQYVRFYDHKAVYIILDELNLSSNLKDWKISIN